MWRLKKLPQHPRLHQHYNLTKQKQHIVVSLSPYPGCICWGKAYNPDWKLDHHHHPWSAPPKQLGHAVYTRLCTGCGTAPEKNHNICTQQKYLMTSRELQCLSDKSNKLYWRDIIAKTKLHTASSGQLSLFAGKIKYESMFILMNRELKFWISAASYFSKNNSVCSYVSVKKYRKNVGGWSCQETLWFSRN